MTQFDFSPTALQELRKRAGMSRTELARKIDRAQLTMIAYENGRTVPSTAVLGRLAAALGCPVDALFQATVRDDGPADVVA